MRLRIVAAVGTAIVMAWALTGCGNQGQSPEDMKELAEAKALCRELGGKFNQWYGMFDLQWRCDFSDAED